MVDEHRQPVHQLHTTSAERTSKPDLHHQHHLHDGPGLGLPIGVHQPPQHRQHQASGGLADIQLGLPSHCHPRQYFTPGYNIIRYIKLSLVILLGIGEKWQMIHYEGEI